ncbi:MAG: tRNA (adenosine(37)-N6)-threonylcarbamoyltransferase complex ATPase subunit type 1 TsaE, partial [Clostridia bacterium]
FVSNSVEETENFATTEIAPLLNGGEVIALYGPMGMGKTAFVRGLAKGLKSTDRVCSPTFAIANVYRCGKEQDCKIKNLAHFDMFRINYYDELEATGFFDYIENGDVVICEWSENIKDIISSLKNKVLKIEISIGENENQRIFNCSI